MSIIEKPIVLVGMMGTGKSFVGARLARDLNLSFYDSDAEIEKSIGKTVAEIFDKQGEDFFRDQEVSVIGSLLKKNQPSVVSTGGGALLREETLRLIKKKSLSIWLQSDSDVIFQRVKEDRSRPLLQQDDPNKTINDLLSQRLHLYEQADIHIDNNANDLSAVVERIKRELRACL